MLKTTIMKIEPMQFRNEKVRFNYLRRIGPMHTCVAVYAMEALVTRVMPCIRALPDRVALQSFSTELGEVNICLKAYDLPSENTSRK